MKDEILPIGSVVTAEGQDVMICAYLKKDVLVDGNSYDYACCLYPFGLKKEAILIKKKQISRIRFVGFQDPRFVELKKKLVDNNE